MESREPVYLHKETRVGLESSPRNVVHVRIPPAPSHPRSSLRKPVSSDQLTEEERAYRSNHLASASAVFHRSNRRSPRSFLWRVLEDDCVVSLRAVDVCRSQKTLDADLVLNFRFPQPIRPSCIAFSEPEDHDALCLFVVDQANHLYSLNLRPDAFRKRSFLDTNLSEACNVYLSSAFSFRHPYRLTAISANQLIVTLHDGGIIRFDKARPHESGASWKETFYNPTGWTQGLRNMLPFHNGHTIKYGRINMEPTAAASLVTSSVKSSGSALLFTICLDHRLRIWNVKDGQILFSSDMLNAERHPQETGKWTVDPAQTNLVRVLDHSDEGCLCITYSPIGAGEFKIWEVVATPNGSFVEDAYPGVKLVPPTPSSSDVWQLADFGVTRTPEGNLQIWTLWKNNMTYRVQNVLLESQAVEQAWADSWTSVFSDNSVPTAQTSSVSDPTDPSERWLQVILYPGRFSQATLQTALAMYERGLGSSRSIQTKSNKAIGESICALIGSTASLDRGSTGDLDYEQFRSTSETQWRRFYRLLVEIDKQRGEALSLSVDAHTGISWIICADCIGAIRECSALDRVYHNITAPGAEFENVASLISAAITFLETFSDSMWQQSVATLKAELFEESSKTDYERIQLFSDKVGFWRQTTDEDAAQIVDVLGSNFQLVTPELYQQLVALTEASGSEYNRGLVYPMTQFGKKVTVKSVQETAELHWLVFFSQLVLLVHMEFEFDQEQDALHSRFDVGLIYRRLIAILHKLELIRWLSRTDSGSSLAQADTNIASAQQPTKPSVDSGSPECVFEQYVSHLLGVDDLGSHDLAKSITDMSASICTLEGDIELNATLAQCSLLVANRPDLALELGPFCDQDAFATYVQGRTFLSLKDYDTATSLFRRAAVGLSTPTKRMDRHSGGLLDTAEWNLLNNGLPRYYAHVATLYEKQRAHSYVVEFARLSLQLAESSVADVAPLKADMLSRLFSASTAISRFDIAYSTLLAIPDSALQHSCLRRLVERMCEMSHNADLVALPFSQLQSAVDNVPQEKCERTTDVARGVQYHNILYAWRVTHGDHRGAAAVQLDGLQKLKQAGEGDQLVEGDSLETPVVQAYLKLINTLSCMDPKQAWVILEETAGKSARRGEKDAPVSAIQQSGGAEAIMADVQEMGTSMSEAAEDEDDAFGTKDQESFFAAMRRDSNEPKRELVTLAQIRKEYQQELDRITAIQNNQFGFGAGDQDEMDQS